MYTIEEIQQKIAPIAKAHNLKAVWLIGSYARGEATENSDIDFLYDRAGSLITSIIKASSMYIDVKELFNVSVDMVCLQALQQSRTPKITESFVRSIEKDKVLLYERGN